MKYRLYDKIEVRYNNACSKRNAFPSHPSLLYFWFFSRFHIVFFMLICLKMFQLFRYLLVFVFFRLVYDTEV